MGLIWLGAEPNSAQLGLLVFPCAAAGGFSGGKIVLFIQDYYIRKFLHHTYVLWFMDHPDEWLEAISNPNLRSNLFLQPYNELYKKLAGRHAELKDEDESNND